MRGATPTRPRGLPLEALKMFRGEPVIETVFPGIGEGWKSLPNRAQRRTARSGRRGKC